AEISGALALCHIVYFSKSLINATDFSGKGRDVKERGLSI
ncbi:6480_t:CDS:1, partial [Funneliformis caledonium]